uniref:Uncharacterized protein n=1 Tax=Pseudictyota dubia TaxID=2749911 RepID=A0A7R9VSM6_9STRA|eukprot:CAMPEP_0197433288 /NCGR_PEP_ID=MMETSP1175-20131217/1210_1 /TAXON_ID=1003142 /ORGANISM="Triceratium dubium, Strain CCMP147" /LENGTH=354 /DNA_ID=CAMNT_0042961619 /DNA_START=62 /DNA_END=1126 /DNA_ORIENTATION=+
MTRLLRIAAVLSVLLPGGTSAFRTLGGRGLSLGGDLVVPNDEIDRSGPSALFKTEYDVGSIYVQHVDMDQSTKIAIVEGMEMEQKMHMEMDAELEVSEVEEPAGGREIDMTFSHVVMNMDAGEGMTMDFDSDLPDDGSNPAFAMMGDMVGQTITVITDEDGDVVEANGLGGLNPLGGGGAAAGAQDPTASLTSPEQFQQMSRMAKVVPADKKVGPGDEWEFEDLQMDGAMSYSGTATFVGYRDHADNNGDIHQVAVFAFEGSLQMDLEKLGNALGVDTEGEDESEAIEMVEEVMESVKVTQSRMTTTMYWDNKDHFIRWSEVSLDMVMQMTNPIDQSLIEVPTMQVLKTSVDKK